MPHLHQQRLANGLWLVAEEIPGAQSLAMSLLLPAGAVQEAPDHRGVAAMLGEMICRGAGALDARAHSDALDQLGVQRDVSAEGHHLHLSAVMIHSKLPEALPLLMDMVRAPRLAPAALDPSRDLALQELDALEDDPQQKVFIELRRRHFPPPFDRSALGERPDLQAMTLEDVREHWQRCFVPDGAILAFAGKLDFADLGPRIDRLLKGWQGACPEPTPSGTAPRGYSHLPAQSAQVHIGLAFDAVAETDPASMLQRAAVAVLSGGMSGRLNTEIREKRGLCYSVGARYAADRQRGVVLGYAGTTTARAQETLDVLAAELKRLAQGVGEDEFQRAIVGMKSGLVMQGESTSARAHAIAADQLVFGAPRSLDDWASRVEAITHAELNRFVRQTPPGPMTVVTIGPQSLRASHEK